MFFNEILAITRAKKTRGIDYIGHCPCHDDGHPSLSIRFFGVDKNPLIKCHSGCLQEDLISYLKDKCLWITQGTRMNNGNNDDFKNILSGARRIGIEDAAHVYLSGRGLLSGPNQASLLFHPFCRETETRRNHPCLIGKIYREDVLIGLQRIYLDGDGKKAAIASCKKIVGKCQGGAVRLGKDVTDTLHIAEGIETSLAVYESLHQPVWAVLSAGNLSTVIIPTTVQRVHIWADLDKSNAGQREALKAAEYFAKRGITAIIHSPEIDIPDDSKGVDWLDVIQCNSAEAVKQALLGGTLFRASESNSTSGKQKKPDEGITAFLFERLESALFFNDQFKNGFISIRMANHKEIWPIDSEDFRLYLGHAYFKESGRGLSMSAQTDAISAFQAKARFAGLSTTVHLRVGSSGKDDSIYYDLCDEQWRVVKIVKEGWEIEDNSEVKFRRTPGMMANIGPSKKGDVMLLKKYLNVRTNDDWLLILSWLIGCLSPAGPYPILIFNGEQGSGKSLMAKILRTVIDPFRPALCSMPQSESDIMITANNSYVLAFDNLSGIKNSISDSLCRLATGGGLMTRKLYTNSDGQAFDLSRPMILNGIDNIASRGDLVSRSIILTIPPLREGRITEKELWQSLEQDKSQILGGLFDIIATAIAERNQITLSNLPRMADFVQWACAGLKHLSVRPETFLEIFNKSQNEISQNNLDFDSTAQVLLDVTNGQHHKFQNVTQLFNRLMPALQNAGSSIRNPSQLSNYLRRLAPQLRAVYKIDINMDQREPGTGQRLVIIEPLLSQPSHLSQVKRGLNKVSDDRDSCDRGSSEQLRDQQ